MLDECFWLSVQSLKRNMEVELVLALVVLARVVELNWAALPDWEWLSYEHGQGAIVMKPGVSSTASQDFEGFEACEVCQTMAISVYGTRYASRRISITSAHDRWRRSLADNVSFYVLPVSEEHRRIYLIHEKLSRALSEEEKGGQGGVG